MSQYPLTPYRPSRARIANLVPFTYRDTMSMLEKIENLQKYVEQFVPEVNDSIQKLVDEFALINEGQLETFNIRFQEFVDQINALVALINNKTGPVDVQHINLIPGDVVTIDVDELFPNNQPLTYVTRQTEPKGEIEVTGVGTVETGLFDTEDYIVFRLLPKTGENSGWFIEQPARVSSEVNVKHFGAIGDGVADDTNSIQRAIDFARDRVRETLMRDGGTVVIPPGKYRVTETITQPPYVHIYTDGNVIINSEVNGTCWHVSALADDPLTLSPELLKEQWHSGHLISGIKGGLIFVNSLSDYLNTVALEVGSRSNLTAQRPTARYHITGVTIYGFNKGILWNTFNHYLASYSNVKIEMCRKHLHIAGSGVNSGENMSFSDSLFGATPPNESDNVAIHVAAPNQDLNFANCSWDFVSTVFKIDRGYGRVLVSGGHIEAVNEGSRYNAGNGIAVSTVGTLDPYERIRMPEVVVDKVTFVQAKRGPQFNGLMRLSFDLTYRVQASDFKVNQNPNLGMLCNNDVIVERHHLITREGGPLTSRKVNLVKDGGLNSEVAGEGAENLNNFTYETFGGATTTVSAEQPYAGAQSLKSVMAASSSVYLTTKGYIPVRPGERVATTFAVRTQELPMPVPYARIQFFDDEKNLIITPDAYAFTHSGPTKQEWLLPSSAAQFYVPPGAYYCKIRFGLSSPADQTYWFGDFYAEIG